MPPEFAPGRSARGRATASGSAPHECRFQAWLKSGVVLCTLANCLKPGLVAKVSDEKKPLLAPTSHPWHRRAPTAALTQRAFGGRPTRRG